MAQKTFPNLHTLLKWERSTKKKKGGGSLRTVYFPKFNKVGSYKNPGTSVSLLKGSRRLQTSLLEIDPPMYRRSVSGGKKHKERPFDTIMNFPKYRSLTGISSTVEGLTSPVQDDQLLNPGPRRNLTYVYKIRSIRTGT